MTRLFGVIACAVAFATVASSSAQADDIGRPTTYCPSTYLCVWWNSHYGGDRFQFAGGNDSWHSWAIADDDSSSYNNGTSGYRAAIYRDTFGEGGRIVCLPRGSWASHHNPNDEGSSNKWIASC